MKRTTHLSIWTCTRYARWQNECEWEDLWFNRRLAHTWNSPRCGYNGRRLFSFLFLLSFFLFYFIVCRRRMLLMVLFEISTTSAAVLACTLHTERRTAWTMRRKTKKKQKKIHCRRCRKCMKSTTHTHCHMVELFHILKTEKKTTKKLYVDLVISKRKYNDDMWSMFAHNRKTALPHLSILNSL